MKAALRTYLLPVAVLLIALGMVFIHGFAGVVLWAFILVAFCSITMALMKPRGLS